MTRLRAVSFDAAGTLFHTARPVGELYAMVAERHGVHTHAQELDGRFRAAFGSAPPLAFPGLPPEEIRVRERWWWRAVVARVFQGIPFTHFDAYFEDLFAFFASAAAWHLDSDALPLLRAARARGLAVLVVSNFDARLHEVLAAFGLTPLIDHVTISSEAGAAKPDPRIFEVALGTAGLASSEVLHVGDTAREDLAGARAAGLEVVLVGGADLAAQAPTTTVVPRLGALAPRILGPALAHLLDDR